MAVVATSADTRIRTLLRAVPEFLRAERPPSAILDRMAQVACEVFQATSAYATLVRADGSFGPSSVASANDSDPDAQRPGAEAVAGAQFLGELMRGSGTLRISDVPGQRSSWRPREPEMSAFLGVQLRAGNRVIGLLYVCDRQDGVPFTPEDEELADSLGQVLGAALENSALLRDTLRDRRWLKAASAMTRELFAADADEPLRIISNRVCELADADVVAMLVLDDEISTIRHAQGPGTQTWVGRSYLTEGTWMGRVARSGRPEVVADLSRVEQSGPRDEAELEIGPAMLLPLRGSDDVLGALFLGREQGSALFSHAALETASSFADHAALTLELAAARQTTEKLRLLEERTRIARDLHDHIIQRLYATGLALQMASKVADGDSRERLDYGLSSIDDTIRQIRETIMALNTVEDSGPTLGPQVERIVREATPLLGFTPMVALESPADEISGPLAGDLVACVREGVSNTVRHARAEHVEIHGWIEASTLHLTLRDDGVGIRSSRRSGLSNLAHRVEHHGGAFEITSSPGEGTALTWRVPLTARP